MKKKYGIELPDKPGFPWFRLKHDVFDTVKEANAFVKRNYFGRVTKFRIIEL